MKAITTTHLFTDNENRCPVCDHILDAVTAEHKHLPSEGDLTVCLYCKNPLVFRNVNKKLRLEILTHEEFLKVKEEDPESALQLLRYIMMFP